ncbi:hypothetical protein [uncultured Thomasclavelia sp.]|uniref:hypothetical protein n=1 Tax=uncultured Thomasclavelia sp. TaxID=3025759 RepID=UPI00280B67C1|nr:hypothetical protein [uncultured Thomasclavelia sp.]
MDVISIFIKTLCDINLNQDSHDTSNSIYEKLETLDIDLYEKDVKNNDKLPYSVRIKIVNLIEFYCLKADECINKYSDKECHEFLRELKIRAEEVSTYIGLI